LFPQLLPRQECGGRGVKRWIKPRLSACCRADRCRAPRLRVIRPRRVAHAARPQGSITEIFRMT
jgi:hypothetical protein